MQSTDESRPRGNDVTYIERTLHLLRWSLLALVLLSAAAQAQPSRLCGQRTDTAACDFFSTFRPDLGDILRYPVDNRDRTLRALALVGGLILLDRPLTEFYQRHVEPQFSGFALPRLPWHNTFRRLGLANEDTWLLTGLAATYAYGAITGREREQRAAALSGEAILYSFLTSQIVLKTIFGRNRPLADLHGGRQPGDGCRTGNPGDFFNSDGIHLRPNMCGTAFPSYHFTQYFAVARVMSGIYDNSWIPYGAALLLSASNIRGHRHWVSDMVAGSLIGLAIGEVVLRNSNTFRAGRFDVVPTRTAGSLGLQFHTRF